MRLIIKMNKSETSKISDVLLKYCVGTGLNIDLIKVRSLLILF